MFYIGNGIVFLQRDKTFKSKKSNFPRSYTQRVAYSHILHALRSRGELCSFRNENHCLYFHTVIKVKCQKQNANTTRGKVFYSSKVVNIMALTRRRYLLTVEDYNFLCSSLFFLFCYILVFPCQLIGINFVHKQNETSHSFVVVFTVMLVCYFFLLRMQFLFLCLKSE